MYQRMLGSRIEMSLMQEIVVTFPNCAFLFITHNHLAKRILLG